MQRETEIQQRLARYKGKRDHGNAIWVLLLPGFYLFTIAGLILIGLVVIEIPPCWWDVLSTSVGHDLSHSADHGHDKGGLLGTWMSWLNKGRPAGS